MVNTWKWWLTTVFNTSILTLHGVEKALSANFSISFYPLIVELTNNPLCVLFAMYHSLVTKALFYSIGSKKRFSEQNTLSNSDFFILVGMDIEWNMSEEIPICFTDITLSNINHSCIY